MRTKITRTTAPRVPRTEKEARFPGLAMPNTKVVDLEDGFGELPDEQLKKRQEEREADLRAQAQVKKMVEKKKSERPHQRIVETATTDRRRASATTPSEKRFVSLVNILTLVSFSTY